MWFDWTLAMSSKEEGEDKGEKKDEWSERRADKRKTAWGSEADEKKNQIYLSDFFNLAWGTAVRLSVQHFAPELKNSTSWYSSFLEDES